MGMFQGFTLITLYSPIWQDAVVTDWMGIDNRVVNVGVDI